MSEKPQNTLGVMGGGQLARMLVQAAQRMGIETLVLDPDPESSAAQISNHHIAAAFDNAAALQELGRRCAGVTTEFENVPATSLDILCAYTQVRPSAHCVSIAQDRVREKTHFQNCGIAVAPFVVLDTTVPASILDSHFPAILKTTRMGYDGKGQVTIHTSSELADAWARLGKVPCVLEQRMALDFECSVVIARGADGQLIYWPVLTNVHMNGILDTAEMYAANVSAALQEKLVAAAKQIASDMHYVGVLCVEFFVLKDGSWCVNEIAPRPHNSGHITMDACDVSQFDAQVRTTMGLPLIQPRQHSAGIMLNILGDVWREDWSKVLALAGVSLHLYGKAEPRKGRKMGHINITAQTIEEACEQLVQVKALLLHTSRL